MKRYSYYLRLARASVFFVVLAWLLFPPVVSASEWAKAYEGSYGEASGEARAIQQTSDGGYVVAGWTENFGAGGADILVLKLDSDGQLEWQRTYGSTNNDKAYSIQQTSDGGYIVAGESASFSADGTIDMWILKLKSNGDIEWEKRYHQNGDHLYEGAYSARQTSDGGYIVVGWMQSNPGGYSDIIAMKLAGDGSIIWQKDIGKKPDGSYSYDPHDDKAYSVEQTSDGGYIIAGKTTASLTWTPVPWIIKLSPTGEIQWNREFPYHLDENGKRFSIKQTSDNEYIYVASLYQSVGQYEALVMKLNSTGDLKWAKIYYGNNRDNAFDINQTNDEGYIVVGRSNSFSGTIATELWLLKLSPTGDVQWQKQYGDADHDAVGFAVEQTGDGGYILAGMSPGNDFWVLKLDSIGSIPDCPLESTTSVTSSDSAHSGKSKGIQAWADVVYAADTTAELGSPEISITEQCLYQPAQYGLTVSISHEEGGTVTADGINCPGDCSESYEEGTDVTLTATPGDGYQFTSWSGDCAECESATCTITMDSDKTCSANFEPLTQPGWQDITDALNITHSARQLYDRIHRCFFIQVTVENPGEEAISGPVRLVITDPSIPVKTGVGVGLEPEGYSEEDSYPYFIIVPEEGSLDAGEILRNLRINFELQRKRLIYGIRVEAESR